MSGDIDLDRHLQAYLAIREALGLAAGARLHLLRSFVDYAHNATAAGTPIRAATALAWACGHASPGCGVAGKAHRLTVARGFLAYLSSVVPGTEVPAHGIMAGPTRRRPYIFSDAEIKILAAAAAKAPPRGSLRPVMLSALLGLLASTGLRIGEAVRLATADWTHSRRTCTSCKLSSRSRASCRFTRPPPRRWRTIAVGVRNSVITRCPISSL